MVLEVIERKIEFEQVLYWLLVVCYKRTDFDAECELFFDVLFFIVVWF